MITKEEKEILIETFKTGDFGRIRTLIIDDKAYITDNIINYGLCKEVIHSIRYSLYYFYNGENNSKNIKNIEEKILKSLIESEKFSQTIIDKTLEIFLTEIKKYNKNETFFEEKNLKNFVKEYYNIKIKSNIEDDECIYKAIEYICNFFLKNVDDEINKKIELVLSCDKSNKIIDNFVCLATELYEYDIVKYILEKEKISKDILSKISEIIFKEYKYYIIKYGFNDAAILNIIDILFEKNIEIESFCKNIKSFIKSSIKKNFIKPVIPVFEYFKDKIDGLDKYILSQENLEISIQEYIKFFMSGSREYIDLYKKLEKYNSFSKSIDFFVNFIKNYSFDNKYKLIELLSKFIEFIYFITKDNKEKQNLFSNIIKKQNSSKNKEILDNLKKKIDNFNRKILTDELEKKVKYCDLEDKEIEDIDCLNCSKGSVLDCKYYKDDYCEKRGEEIEISDCIKCCKKCIHEKNRNVSIVKKIKMNYCSLLNDFLTLSKYYDKEELLEILKIKKYPAVNPEKAEEPYKLCLAKNCTKCPVKYKIVDTETYSIELEYDEKLYEQMTSEDNENRCQYIKGYDNDNLVIKFSNRLESMMEEIDVHLEIINSLNNAISNILKKNN